MTSLADKRWSAHIARLRNSPESKSLGVSFALASELFLLKAENKRLRLVLKRKGLLDDRDETAVAESEEFRKWLQNEQTAFSRSIFKAWLETDSSPDVSGEFESEVKAKA
jgi:hypothetical protein